MTVRSRLMPLAAALAALPLYAQQTPAPATASTAPAADMAPLGAAEESPARMRAEALAPLAHIPANVEAALVVTKEIRPGGPVPFESLALGCSKGSAATLATLGKLTALVPAINMTDEIAGVWGSVAKDTLRESIKGFGVELARQGMEHALGLASQAVLHPVYIVFSLGDEEEAMQAYQALSTQADYHCQYDKNAEKADFGRLGGLKYNLAGTIPAEALYAEDSSPETLLLVKGLENRSVYILFKREGRQVLGVVCENPEEIAFAESGEGSVLNTPAWQAVAPPHEATFIGAASLSPEMLNAANAHTQASWEWVASAADLFLDLAGQHKAYANTFQAAAAGVKALAGQAQGLMPPVDKPLFCQIWKTPGGYHGELTCDAMGLGFAPAPTALADQADSPDTVFLLETSPLNIGDRCKTPDLQALGQATLDIFNGIAASLADGRQRELREATRHLTDIQPLAAGTLSAFGTMLGGIGGTTSILIDGKGTAPEHLVGRGEAPMFRIALRTGVKDRTKLAQGWDALLKVAGDAVEKHGQDRSMIDMLPIVPTKSGKNAVRYSLALPGVLTPDMGAYVGVGDSVLVASSSSALNKELISATGKGEFAGISFVFNTKPLAETARGIADAMFEAAGPIPRKIRYWDAESKSSKEALLDEAGFTEDGQNAEGLIVYSLKDEPTDAQLPAVRACRFAAALEELASKIQKVNGSITIEEDVATIRVHVRTAR